MRSGLTTSVLAAELLKVRKRWLLYTLLVPVVALIALQTFAAYFAGWRHDRDLEALRVAVLPSSLTSLLDLVQYLGSITLAIVAASAVATEHAWGTVRQALIRGQTRSQYLTAKLLSLGIMGALGFCLVLAFGLICSAVLTALEDRGVAGPSAGEAVLMVLRTAYAIVPYLLLSFCLAVVGRSTTLGVGGTLVYIIGESILLGVLGGIGGGAADARAFFLGHNVGAVMAANRLTDTDFISLAPRPAPPIDDLPSAAAAALVVALYCVIFLAIAYGVFQRRDLTSETSAG